jgi:hypothetical protein
VTSHDAALGFSAEVPERLRHRVAALLADRRGQGAADPDTILQVVVAATRDLLERQPGDRGTALDLLAVDALVTHAMELIAARPGEFEARCLDAMRRLSTIARAP